MIDLSEPKRLKLTENEENEVNQRFLVLLHSFLLFYLALHNMLLPVCMNLVKGREIFQDVHYWFLFQLPVHYWLRKKIPINFSYNLFLCLGSLSRLIVYSVFLYSKSWTIVSVLLSELSSLIFIFLLWGKTSQSKFLPLSFFGLIVPAALAFVEVHPPDAQKSFPVREHAPINYQELGCKGAAVTVSMHGISEITKTSHSSIADCGFADNLLVAGGNFNLTNLSSTDVNARIYELKRKEGRYSWKFIRLLRIEKNKKIYLDKFLKSKTMYLVKSPERIKLGMMVIIPSDSELSGTFDININSLNWSQDE